MLSTERGPPDTDHGHEFESVYEEIEARKSPIPQVGCTTCFLEK